MERGNGQDEHKALRIQTLSRKRTFGMSEIVLGSDEEVSHSMSGSLDLVRLAVDDCRVRRELPE
jgi:hypothetical protein